MSSAYANRLFIITGGCGGFGKAFAEQILRNKGKVVLSDVAQESGEKLASDLEKCFGKNCVAFVKCDVTDKKALETLWDRAEEAFTPALPVSVFINNAGVTFMAGIEKCFEINFNGVVNGTYLALERMGKQGHGTKALRGQGGQVINVASLAGLTLPTLVDTESYYISKNAVVSLTRNIGLDVIYKEEGVRVNCLCPGFVDTPLFNQDPKLKAQVGYAPRPLLFAV